MAAPPVASKTSSLSFINLSLLSLSKFRLNRHERSQEDVSSLLLACSPLFREYGRCVAGVGDY